MDVTPKDPMRQDDAAQEAVLVEKADGKAFSVGLAIGAVAIVAIALAVGWALLKIVLAIVAIALVALAIVKIAELPGGKEGPR